MASLTPTPKQQIYGSDGAPLVGGKIYTYSAGTTTPLATYTNAGGGTANTNPIILNSLGQADIWLAPSASYKFSVYTSADVLLYTVDNIAAPVDYLSLAAEFASPPPIGSTAPDTGEFTTSARRLAPSPRSIPPLEISPRSMALQATSPPSTLQPATRLV